MQTQIAISSTQQETRAPPTSLQMTATVTDTSTFTAQEFCLWWGFGWRSNTVQEPQRHLHAPTTANNDAVFSAHQNHQHVECTFVILISRLHHQLSHSPNTRTNRYGYFMFNSKKQCCACGGGEHNLLIDANVSNRGYTCSDIAVFRPTDTRTCVCPHTTLLPL